MSCATVTKSTQAVENEKSYERIAEIIERHKGREDSLIQVLHEAQEVYGYLPLALQKFISRGMDIPLAKVSGVVSFYSFFSTEPRGEHTIRVCMGTACYVRGGGKIVKYLRERLGVELGETTTDGKFTFEVARCFGSCGLAPAMMIDDTVYKQVNVNRIERVLENY